MAKFTWLAQSVEVVKKTIDGLATIIGENKQSLEALKIVGEMTDDALQELREELIRAGTLEEPEKEADENGTVSD